MRRAAGLGEALERRLHLELGLGAADPVGALDGLAGLEVLVDLEEVLDLEAVELRDVADVAQVLQAGSLAGTQRTLSSPPASSVMRNMPIARHLIRQPGNVGSCRITIASSGSPSRPRVFSM